MVDDQFRIDGVLSFGVVKDDAGVPVFCSQCVEGRAGDGPSIFVLAEFDLANNRKRVSNEEFSSQIMALGAYHGNSLTWSEWK